MKFSLRLRMNKNLDPIAMPTTEIPVLSLSTTWRATAAKNLKQFSKKSGTALVLFVYGLGLVEVKKLAPPFLHQTRANVITTGTGLL